MTPPSREFDISPQRLQHIRWIGGGSGAGKSTVARFLEANHGLRLYCTDDMQSAHTARSNPADHPLLHAFLAMTMDERWAKRTPEEMFRTFRRAALASRGSTWSIAGRTSDPETALTNLLARDALYTEEVFRQASALQLTTIEVNGSASVDELATRVAQCLGIRR
jgi:NAD(P)-dependent dehydrogenase (short-subunit alcohol dehydrogenase family)